MTTIANALGLFFVRYSSCFCYSSLSSLHCRSQCVTFMRILNNEQRQDLLIVEYLLVKERKFPENGYYILFIFLSIFIKRKVKILIVVTRYFAKYFTHSWCCSQVRNHHCIKRLIVDFSVDINFIIVTPFLLTLTS